MECRKINNEMDCILNIDNVDVEVKYSMFYETITISYGDNEFDVRCKNEYGAYLLSCPFEKFKELTKALELNTYMLDNLIKYNKELCGMKIEKKEVKKLPALSNANVFLIRISDILSKKLKNEIEITLKK